MGGHDSDLWRRLWVGAGDTTKLWWKQSALDLSTAVIEKIKISGYHSIQRQK